MLGALVIDAFLLSSSVADAALLRGSKRADPCYSDADCSYQGTCSGYVDAGMGFCYCNDNYCGDYCEYPCGNEPSYPPSYPSQPPAMDGGGGGIINNYYRKVGNGEQRHAEVCENEMETKRGIPGDDSKICEIACTLNFTCAGFNWVPSELACHFVSYWPFAPAECPTYVAQSPGLDLKVGWEKVKVTSPPSYVPPPPPPPPTLEGAGSYSKLDYGMKNSKACENGREAFGLPGDGNRICDPLCDLMPGCHGYNWYPLNFTCRFVSMFPLGPAECPTFISGDPLIDRVVGWTKNGWQDETEGTYPAPPYPPAPVGGYQKLAGGTMKHAPMCETSKHLIGLPGSDHTICHAACNALPGCIGYNWRPANLSCAFVNKFPLAPIGCPAFTAQGLLLDLEVGWERLGWDQE